MIIKNLLDTIYTVITTVLGYIPSLPPVPDTIQSYTDVGINMFLMPVGILKFFYGADFFNVILGLLVVLFTWKQGYHLTLWIVKKIPALNIH